MKTVIVACASGIATSQIVARKIDRLLQEREILAHIEPVPFDHVEHYLEKADAYVAVTKITKDYDIPILNGIVFLTGVGMHKELEKLIAILKQSE